MLTENLHIFRRLHLLADLALTVLAFELAGKFAGNSNPQEGYSSYWDLTLFIIVVWGVLLSANRNSYKFRMQDYWNVLKNSSLVVIQGMLVLLAFAYFSGWGHQSRGVMAAFAVIDFLLLFGFRSSVAALLVFCRRKGYNFKTVLLVGTGRKAREFIQYAQEKRGWGLKIIGIIEPEKQRGLKRFYDTPVVGDLERLPEIIQRGHIDYVVFALPRRFLDFIDPTIRICEEMGACVHVLADFFSPRVGRWKVESLFGKPVLSLTTTSTRHWGLWAKDLLDRTMALLGFMLVSPLVLIISALIKLTSKGPVFFKQRRCGLNGREFTLLKFRTMVDNAESLKESLLDKNEMDGPVFKIKDDPRVTPLGRFLRKTSFDELPQLMNIIAGQMSLVGPRPPLRSEVVQYDRWQRRKLSMKPGITCLWQISGRNNIGFEDWMRLDLEYIDNWSLWQDTKILLKTFPVVLSRKGAH